LSSTDGDKSKNSYEIQILSDKHPVHSRWDIMKQAITFVCNISTQKANCLIHMWINV